MTYQPQAREARLLTLAPDHESRTWSSDEKFGKGSIFFIGTATVIIKYGGFTILTDPNFLHAGDHVHLGWGITSKRVTNPAIEMESLPPVDFILLSHYHGDHFDRIVEARLNRSIPIVTTKHATNELRSKGFQQLHPLESWEKLVVMKGDAKLTITAMPGQHAPPPLQHLHILPPVMGSMLEFEYVGMTMNAEKNLMRIYISGDTLMGDYLLDIPRIYPNIDIALIHLGGTTLLGVLLVTMDAKQGVELVQVLKPEKVIPIHYNDYEVFKSGLDEFKAAVTKAGLDERMVYLNHGDTYDFAVKRWKSAEPVTEQAPTDV